MSTRYNIVVMGDINLDWHATRPLSFPFTDLVSNGIVEWSQIEELPGGSGLNFAQFAQRIGYAPLLLAKIGNDPAGRYLFEWLQRHKLEAGVIIGPSLSTGKAFIARDKRDIRFLVNNTPNANRALSFTDVEQFSDVIASCQLLYVSGYCIMEPQAPQTVATLRAMEIARSYGKAKIVFDVVPHQIYKIYTFPQFQQITQSVDILVSEVATMRHYTSVYDDHQEGITRQSAEKVAKLLSSDFNRFILRYGPSGCDEQVIWDSQSNQLLWEETREHAHLIDKRGFGDWLTLKTLKDVFKIEIS